MEKNQGAERQSNIRSLPAARMALRKRINREKVSAESQEDNAPSDRDDMSSTAATREMRRREREHKSKNKELTEEEMMALALRISEQEANITAQKVQEEEENVRKAIQDSMLDESQSLINDAPTCISTRRKLTYSNGEHMDAEHSTTEGEGRGWRATGHVNRTRKRRREEGSPLMEMPDLSQTQPSPNSSESAALGSPQSGESTQIEDNELPQSPVFPSSSVQPHVQVPKLTPDQLDSCTVSGFVLCSQESGVSALSSHCQQPRRSPTFHKSPALHSKIPVSGPEGSNSQMLQLGEDTQTELSQPHTSPLFGQTDCKSALHTDTMEASAITFSSQESSVLTCLEKDVSLCKSPVFSKTQGGMDASEGSQHQSPIFGTNGRTVMTCEDELEKSEDKEPEEEQSLSLNEPSINMTLHWSDEDEDDTTPVVSPSPVFPEESRVLQTKTVNEEPSQTQCRATDSKSQSAVSEAPCLSEDPASQSTIHYYWGVPFCPRGLDPDQYTQVIVAQMNVYEKSLKQAQRGLLNKAPWGEPILPQPEKSPSPEPSSSQTTLLTRRSRRQRSKLKELESDEEMEKVTEDTQGSERSEREEEEGDKETKQDTEEKTGMEEDEQQQTEVTDEGVLEDLREDETQVESDCDVCPETPLSDDNTQELTLPSQPMVRSPEIEMVQVDSPNVPEVRTQEPEEPMELGPGSSDAPASMKLGGPFCKSRKSSEQEVQSSDLEQNLDSEEHLRPDQVPDPTLGFCLESPVQCPLCQRVFPSNQIEMHAAFCDGEPAAGDKASPKQRRKRRRGQTEDASHADSESSVAQAVEKCYICKKIVPLREYSRHTDHCLQRPLTRTTTNGGLLSALDRSEHKDSEAGPSGSTAQPQEVIDLLDDDEEDSVSLIQISNSPIRSFTSISDATDCLIDFSRQHQGKKPATRPGTKYRSKRR